MGNAEVEFRVIPSVGTRMTTSHVSYDFFSLFQFPSSNSKYEFTFAFATHNDSTRAESFDKDHLTNSVSEIFLKSRFHVSRIPVKRSYVIYSAGDSSIFSI
jgi:hypothetical protein